MLNRRDVLGLTVGAGLLAGMDSPLSRAAHDPEHSPADASSIIDTNCHLFDWPFRKLPLDTPQTLVRRMSECGVTHLWAGSFEALLHRDIDAVNARLAETCRQHAMLVPVGAVNLSLPDWETTLRNCVHRHAMPGIRVYPAYHGYELTDPRVVSLLRLATASKCFVQIVVSMEDTRTQPDLLRVDDVDVSALPEVMRQAPDARVQLLNHRLRGAALEPLARVPGLWFDTARIDGTDAVPSLIASVNPGRVLFGSHAPFLIPEAALIRVYESGQLDQTGMHNVFSNNARRFMEGAV